MSKHQHQNKPQAKAAEVEKVEAVEKPKRIRPLAWYERCPICYGGRGGVGVERWHRRINGTLMRKCYVCDTCGHDWTAMVRTVTVGVQVEYNDVSIEHRDVDLEER